MDVSQILASSNSKHNSTTVKKSIPLDVDVGYLTVTDFNPVDAETYKADLEEYLQSVARDGAQVLISSLFGLPTQSSGDGPLATLPPPMMQLPRAKPLPKLKTPTKWERFASAKGIQKRRHEKKVWDDEKQEWVDNWGPRSKRREKEEQWITEVRANADLDHNPAKAARDSRKSRIAKNKVQQIRNNVQAQRLPSARKDVVKNIDMTLATSRISTASMGKFDKKLEGEKKLRGVKRKFDTAEASAGAEKKASLALISKLNKTQQKAKRGGPAGNEEKIWNSRKAIRSTSKKNEI